MDAVKFLERELEKWTKRADLPRKRYRKALVDEPFSMVRDSKIGRAWFLAAYRIEILHWLLDRARRGRRTR